ncbi:FlgT C-terminal domain-containing protein [Natroniella sp. ANB-PHB2]|uniref:FlgT C-terminal domain-containing protein n=1 Tax=Natroniella sp. ANB-PHB2 TaxID=3384444 RepID=UPI0038D3E2D1
MKKIIPLILCLLILSSGGVSGNQEFAKIDGLMDDLFSEIRAQKGQVIKSFQSDIYLNLGQSVGLKPGDRFEVIKQGELLTDPATGMNLGRVEIKVAEVEVVTVRDEFSIAEVVKEYSSAEIEPLDLVTEIDYAQQVVNLGFSSDEQFDKLTARIEEVVSNYLKQDGRFEKVKNVEEFELEEKLTGQKLSILADELDVDLLLTGRIYEQEDSFFVYIGLFERKLGNITDEEVIRLAKDGQLVTYYLKQEEQEDYQLLFEQEFDYLAGGLAIGDTTNDGRLEVILNTKKALKFFNYKDEKLAKQEKITDNYRITRFDDYKVLIGDTNNNGTAEIIVDNYRNLISFEWDGSEYLREDLNQFNRDRPKLILELAGQDYLVTRDYTHFLKFNLWDGVKYQVDFELDLAINEGFRLEVVDLTGNGEEELILTAFDGDQKYEIEIYNLAGESQSTLPGSYGPTIAVGDLNQDGVKEIFLSTYHGDQSQITSYFWDGEDYSVSWESQELTGEIIELAVADLTDDGEKELVVLALEDDISKIYLYQRK